MVNDCYWSFFRWDNDDPAYDLFYHQVLGLACFVDKAMLYCTSFEGER